MSNNPNDKEPFYKSLGHDTYKPVTTFETVLDAAYKEIVALAGTIYEAREALVLDRRDGKSSSVVACREANICDVIDEKFEQSLIPLAKLLHQTRTKTNPPY